jgi:CRISPR-associated protein Cas5h
MQKLISIDLFADFGMLKKPDTNDPVYLTFNLLHKPALLGIVGAIIGEKGFIKFGELPDYYEKLKELKIGIRPLNHEKGNYQKSIIKYTNQLGFANKGEEYKKAGKMIKPGATLIIEEQTLIAPAFRCFFLLDFENDLHKKIDNNLKNQCAEYLPYLGKNEFSVWWKNYNKYDEVSDFDFSKEYKIESIFYKNEAVNKHIAASFGRSARNEIENRFTYFERLPLKYNEAKNLIQYEYADFVYTNAKFETDLKIEDVKVIDKGSIIQLF